MIGKEDLQKINARVGLSITETVENAWPLVATAGAAMGAYHGYKRNNSVGWAIVWALVGGMFPVITIPVSLAQGFGKKA